MSDTREAFEKIQRQFTSTNSIDVERATVLRSDWELAKQHMADRAQGDSEPVGWKLAPIVPTKSMQDAWDIAPTNECADQEFIDAYQAMLDAAPQPPLEQDHE